VNNSRANGANDNSTLDNSRNIKEFKPISAVVVEGIYIWGGAFWELRKSLGQNISDKLLYMAWQSIQGSDIKKNNPKDFVDSVLKADRLLEGSRHDSQIKEVFRRRGMEL
jgi:hypothetical protein